jgi:hypothetical protein
MKLDKIGAHFRFSDMYARLSKVVQYSLQEKRMTELAIYQEHFSAKDPELLNPVT